MIFKPFPEVSVEPGMIDGIFAIKTARNVLAYGKFKSAEDAQRFADCWNACRKLAFPSAHIEETGEYVKRLEQLRKDAWARVVELEALASAVAKSPEAAQ